ncbi:quinone oxidoreductase family protein [Pseudomonas syringae]|uniref:Quinone oxidoreductase n=1 Tax=Pseudomonas syringae pv. aceris TaxID=199198 RepID=A0A0L8IPY6_PSESX|nr:quinone oxidoreductase [Pseudomonas syringae]EGH71549.1 quinone oxidoreductase [Pseudomonas syringae pv. aceris str. M302273]KOG03488.1 Quinone oxidoreductase [Pseudomonas syringae pv. aceris]KPW09177.1 Quinone oxidoreductase [Pseudomonas syringae pv. aceris]
MVAVVRFAQAGNPHVLKIEQADQVAPGAGEVWLEQEAIGVNFLDVTQRNGAVAVPLPNGLGLEGAGTVAAVGEGVDNVKVGDRVAYATGPLGSYASGRLYPASKLIKLPDQLSCEDAAAVLFKGITAQYLLKSTYPVGPGTTMLLYGVAGGLGELTAPWAKHLGAFVIGVVSREQSVAKAKALGCDAVLVFDAQTLAADVARITDGEKVDVVYDPIGKISFDASLDSLKPRGLMVSFGASSGAPAPLEVGTLNAKGSLFLTRPSIVAHTSDVAEYRERAADVFAAVEAGIIKPSIWKRYPLADVAQAHADLEGGKSSGTIVLIP